MEEALPRERLGIKGNRNVTSKGALGGRSDSDVIKWARGTQSCCPLAPALRSAPVRADYTVSLYQLHTQEAEF